MPASWPTDLVSLLRVQAARRGDGALAFRFLVDGEVSGPAETLSYRQLEQKAAAIGAALQQACTRGERAILLYPPGLDFISAFFGCLFGGIISVPAYPPDPSRLERTLPRLRAIARDSGAALVLTTSAVLGFSEALFPLAPELAALRWIATDAVTGDAQQWQDPGLRSDDVAFLQYTSGSTGTPKGVVLTHANLLNNLEAMHQRLETTELSRLVSWLPMYHDMGLIGGLLSTLYSGGSATLMSPLSFLAWPQRWLQAISHSRATHTVGPDFAYALCVRKSTPAALVDLDLRSLLFAMTAAEPIRPTTIDAFAKTFGPCGFRREAFYPAYGLAESTVFTAGGTASAPPILGRFDAGALAEGRAVAAAGADDAAQVLIGCGQQLPDHKLVIVDPERLTLCEEGRLGEIWVLGPSVARGYWNRPAETHQTFEARVAETGEGPFLRTGDLGFLRDGELFVAGRRKDLIILRGRNLYPQDLESTVERCHPAIRPGCTAAFSIDRGGEEQLVVVAESDPRAAAEPAALVARINQALFEEHELAPAVIAILPAGTIPKTSSGKIQRHACRAGLLDGSLQITQRFDGGLAASQPATPGPREEARPGVSVADANAAPQTQPLQHEIAALRAEVASVLALPGPEAVPIDEPFYSLGLDSLKTVELQQRLAARAGKPLPAGILFHHPTPRELARYLLEQPAALRPQASAAPELALELKRVPPQEHYPLSLFERELFGLIERQPCQDVYNVFLPLRVSGPLDEAALQRAFEALIQRQDNLRTAFLSVNGTPVRQVLHRIPFSLPVEDLSQLAPAEREEAILRGCREVRQVRFDLGRPGLFCVRLLKLAPQESLLLVQLSHLLADGFGLAILYRELAALYEAEVTGREADLQPLMIRARDYAVAADRCFRNIEARPKAAYPDYPAHEFRLPPDGTTTGDSAPHAALYSERLDDGLRADLARLVRAHGHPWSVLCLVAFQAALHRITQREEVLFAVVFANRRARPMRDVVCHMMYREMFHGDARGRVDYLTLLGAGRRFLLEERLSEEPRVILTQPPAMRVVLNFQHYQPELGTGPVRFAMAPERLAPPLLWDSADLSFQIFSSNQSILCRSVYRPELYGAATILRLHEQLRRSLTEMAADPHQTFLFD